MLVELFLHWNSEYHILLTQFILIIFTADFSLLSSWNNGKNHLLFNMLPGSMPKYPPFLEVESGYAMVTSGGFSSVNHRMGFDISIPVYSPLAVKLDRPTAQQLRPWLIISPQSNIHEEFRNVISEVSAEHLNLLALDRCSTNPLDTTLRCREDEVYSYPEILKVLETFPSRSQMDQRTKS